MAPLPARSRLGQQATRSLLTGGASNVASRSCHDRSRLFRHRSFVRPVRGSGGLPADRAHKRSIGSRASGAQTHVGAGAADVGRSGSCLVAAAPRGVRGKSRPDSVNLLTAFRFGRSIRATPSTTRVRNRPATSTGSNVRSRKSSSTLRSCRRRQTGLPRASWSSTHRLPTAGSAGPTADLYLRDPRWYRDTGAPLARDGTLPFYRYVIRSKGRIEVGILSCGMCHTRVMPDGTLLKGAQGNFPFGRALASDMNQLQSNFLKPLNNFLARRFQRLLFAAPWVTPDAYPGVDHLSAAEIAAHHAAVPPGVMARHGTSPLVPAKVPDLIGIQERGRWPRPPTPAGPETFPPVPRPRRDVRRRREARHRPHTLNRGRTNALRGRAPAPRRRSARFAADVRTACLRRPSPE